MVALSAMGPGAYTVCRRRRGWAAFIPALRPGMRQGKRDECGLFGFAHRREIHLLAHRAIRAGPGIRNLRPAGAWRIAFARAALGFVVDVAAVGALVTGDGGGCSDAGGAGSVAARKQIGVA